MPVYGAVAAGVIEAVLGARRAVEIDHYFETGTSGPANCLVEDGKLALHIWVTIQGRDSPVTDWDADMVQASCCDLVEVGLGNPGVPVISKA